MSYRIRSGSFKPPIYEKERALRMARKLGLRVIRTSRGHNSPAADAEFDRDNEVSRPSSSTKESHGLTLGQVYKLPLTGEGAP
jgi:hypothetical protein